MMWPFLIIIGVIVFYWYIICTGYYPRGFGPRILRRTRGHVISWILIALGLIGVFQIWGFWRGLIVLFLGYIILPAIAGVLLGLWRAVRKRNT